MKHITESYMRKMYTSTFYDDEVVSFSIESIEMELSIISFGGNVLEICFESIEKEYEALNIGLRFANSVTRKVISLVDDYLTRNQIDNPIITFCSDGNEQKHNQRNMLYERHLRRCNNAFSVCVRKYEEE